MRAGRCKGQAEAGAGSAGGGALLVAALHMFITVSSLKKEKQLYELYCIS